MDIEPCFCTGSPDSFLRKPRRLLRRPFRLDLIQLLPGLSQLFPGALRFGLRLLVLVLFTPGLLGGASGSCALPVSCGLLASSSCLMRSEGRLLRLSS
ncbi:hypothetical protein [Clostridium sp. AM48-13]|uniref:hypothetical protein n=1 Tax=Clostridium sp. AM48-13 TaxID=2293034 RepID=UPI001FAA7EE6